MNSAKQLIAVIRRGPADRAHYLSWIRDAGHHVVDVCRTQDVRVLNVSSAGEADCLLLGLPLEEFDAVLYLGAAGAFSLNSTATVDRQYLNAELDAAFMAALWNARRPKILNPGYVFAWNRFLLEPSFFVRRAVAAGWSMPVVTHETSLADVTSDLEIAGQPHLKTSVKAFSQRWRDPEPPENSRRLLVIPQHGRSFFADTPESQLSSEISDAAAAIQGQLEHLGLHWATVAMASLANTPYAFGIRADLPQSLGTTAAVAVINQALVSERGQDSAKKIKTRRSAESEVTA